LGFLFARQNMKSVPPEKIIEEATKRITEVPLILNGVCYGKYVIMDREKIPPLKMRIAHYLSHGGEVI